MDKGLHKIVDLGNYWEEKMQLPIPLGGIAGKRSLDENILIQVDALIKESMEYAFEHYPLISDYVKQHSQEMEVDVMKKHIDLYVNNYSINLGNDGRNAVKKFLEIYKNMHGTIAPQQFNEDEIFVKEL
jgi:1,4-dihydroxy-6-naphthoate synthase